MAKTKAQLKPNPNALDRIFSVTIYGKEAELYEWMDRKNERPPFPGYADIIRDALRAAMAADKG